MAVWTNPTFATDCSLLLITLNGEKNVCLKDLDHKLKEESKRKYESRQRELWIKQRDD
jgi:hypothetical protein